jgi:hypothetical protein
MTIKNGTRGPMSLSHADETNWIAPVGDLQFQSQTLYHWAKETCPTNWTSRNVVKFRYIAFPPSASHAPLQQQQLNERNEVFQSSTP